MLFHCEDLIENIRQVREHNPLIINLTNDVVTNVSANMLLACGASPIMAHSRRELDELIAQAQAVVINIGTLDEIRVARMQMAIDAANRYQKLVVLDPVGCGASQYRTQTAQHFVECTDHLVIRANASELLALADRPRQGQGVDSGDDSTAAIAAAKFLQQQWPHKPLLEISISGACDQLILRDQHYQITNGHPMMTHITGTGCSLSALTAAYRSTHPAGLLTSAAVMSIAGEIAASQVQGPAALQQLLIDTIYQLSAEQMHQHLNLEWVS
ncbi:hydroxyethylthiazole kinase [Celerinatantimonas yamalensis]|uniref:Hydroxyethylthiazole kinase n=1 Tax=Celerinatantimonas yamalensis TaxID=559956 RepID=A0ABW9GF59_9GAMM